MRRASPSSAPPLEGHLVEIWNDTADTRHLGWAIVLGVAISISGFLLANRMLTGFVPDASLARAYAMLAGLAGCIIAGAICAFIFPPKRSVVEDSELDPAWRNEVLAELASERGGLGTPADLSPASAQELRELGLYDAFADYQPEKAIVAETFESTAKGGIRQKVAA